MDYVNDYLPTREERMKILMDIKDEDIDYSDIPPVSDEALAHATRVGDKFIKMGKRNMAILNELLRKSELEAIANLNHE
ncbi:MAG: hypothetical protein IJ576_04460 [Synergistaceae bacterium]|nr:hypothetical protein [Synergistaceae bacterium]MBR1418201.1 hypothetical protein [Synergistaceae bacterium]